MDTQPAEILVGPQIKNAKPVLVLLFELNVSNAARPLFRPRGAPIRASQVLRPTILKVKELQT